MDVTCAQCRSVIQIRDDRRAKINRYFTCPSCGRLQDAPSAPGSHGCFVILLLGLVATIAAVSMATRGIQGLGPSDFDRRAILVYLSRHTPNPGTIEVVEWGHSLPMERFADKLPAGHGSAMAYPVKYRSRDDFGNFRESHQVFVVKLSKVLLVAPYDPPAASPE